MKSTQVIKHSGARALLGCAILLTSAMTLAGCALLSKSDPLVPRYFTLDQGAPVTAPASSQDAFPAGAALRLALGRVTAGSQLRERMVVRSGAHELAFRDDRRWTERPDAYLRRALERTLFERRGIARVMSGQAPLLQAELVSFEEVRGERPHVHMQVVITLDDRKTMLLMETIAMQQPIANTAEDAQADAVAAAFAEVLHACVERIADRVTAALGAPP